MQVLGFHFVKNAKNKEILHVTGSNPVQYVRTATSMIVCNVWINRYITELYISRY